jgi:membrane protein required for colicin V production
MLFDVAVWLVMFVAVLAGFHAGFLRSMVTILAYLVAMPVAVALAPILAPLVAASAAAPWASGTVLLFAVFLVTGIALGALARHAIGEMTGARISIPDRLLGAALGALRIALVAVLVVLVFDRLIPPEREPSFLRGSTLRPWLSLAGQRGLKSLPPDTVAYIDQLKKDRRL